MLDHLSQVLRDRRPHLDVTGQLRPTGRLDEQPVTDEPVHDVHHEEREAVGAPMDHGRQAPADLAAESRPTSALPSN